MTGLCGSRSATPRPPPPEDRIIAVSLQRNRSSEPIYGRLCLDVTGLAAADRMRQVTTPLRVFQFQAALKATRAGNGNAQPRVAAFDDLDISDGRFRAAENRSDWAGPRWLGWHRHGVAFDGGVVFVLDGAQAGGYAGFAVGDELAVGSAEEAFGQVPGGQLDLAKAGFAYVGVSSDGVDSASAPRCRWLKAPPPSCGHCTESILV